MQIYWTAHARDKMRYYKLSESRIKRVLNYPKRVEEGIAENTVAMMQSGGTGKNPYEIWIMVQESKPKSARSKTAKEKDIVKRLGLKEKMIKIISAWRYPGVTKPGEKLPEEILLDLRSALE
ncbi:MAG: hypothetical protein M1312_02655 [Patescibacteria group bacterium]|nr:hypothetical protein [Patescibacteria group bacterium]MDE2144395.1 hypothetical protein [Patescibacteria group bacterium]